MQENLKYWIWLSSLPKIGPKRSKQLLEYFGDPLNVWEASEADLRSAPFMTDSILKQLTSKMLRNETKKHIKNLHECGVKVIRIIDEEYPENLKNIYDPPLVLYIKGTIRKDENIVAVVGSRKATAYGLGIAEQISRELTKYGITVASGMARGIDSYAHNGALKSGGKTIAVLGCGLDIVYPYENRKMMEMIIKSGAVISEYLPGVPPIPYNFPARNRIISGISLGVVVIEAGEKSGSLITANFALEQGREVFAVPGNVTSSTSTGTNKLIRDGAKMVIEIEDIMEELKIFNFVNNNKSSEYKSIKSKMMFDKLDNNEKKIAELLMIEPVHIDLIAQKCNIEMQYVNSILVMMEMKGLVEQLPGKIFRLKS